MRTLGPLTEFAYHTAATTGKKLSSCRSLCDFDLFRIHLANDYELCYPATEEWLDQRTTVRNDIYNVLKRINDDRRTLYVANARHFNADNWVLVDRQDLQVNGGNNKSLTQKWLGPYKFINDIGLHAY